MLFTNCIEIVHSKLPFRFLGFLWPYYLMDWWFLIYYSISCFTCFVTSSKLHSESPKLGIYGLKLAVCMLKFPCIWPLRALSLCVGFVDLQHSYCSEQAAKMSQSHMCPLHLCSPPKKHVHTKFRMHWPYSRHAEMEVCACTQNLLGSRSFWLNWTCVVGLTFLRNRLSVFLVCNCSEISQTHQFPCACIIWIEILDKKYGNPAFNTSSTRERGNECGTILACSIFTLDWLL